MKGKMRVIAVDGTETVTTYTEAKHLDLDTLKAAVGGWIEAVPYWKTVRDPDAEAGASRVPCVVFCNEEGKMMPHMNLPVNPTATRLWRDALFADHKTSRTPGNDFLVGPIAIVTGDPEFMEEL